MVQTVFQVVQTLHMVRIVMKAERRKTICFHCLLLGARAFSKPKGPMHIPPSQLAAPYGLQAHNPSLAWKESSDMVESWREWWHYGFSRTWDREKEIKWFTAPTATTRRRNGTGLDWPTAHWGLSQSFPGASRGGGAALVRGRERCWGNLLQFSLNCGRLDAGANGRVDGKEPFPTCSLLWQASISQKQCAAWIVLPAGCMYWLV